MAAEVELFLVCVDEYRDDGTPLYLSNVAYKRYLMSGTDLHEISNLAAQRLFMCDEKYKEMGLKVPGDKDVWDFERLITIE